MFSYWYLARLRAKFVAYTDHWGDLVTFQGVVNLLAVLCVLSFFSVGSRVSMDAR